VIAGSFRLRPIRLIDGPDERPLDPPRWNFHKYLVGRDGHIAAAFSSEIEPGMCESWQPSQKGTSAAQLIHSANVNHWSLSC
jgi:hypothetical protein